MLGLGAIALNPMFHAGQVYAMRVRVQLYFVGAGTQTLTHAPYMQPSGTHINIAPFQPQNLTAPQRGIVCNAYASIAGAFL